MPKLSNLSSAWASKPTVFKSKPGGTYTLTDDANHAVSLNYLGASQGELIFTASTSRKTSYFLTLEQNVTAIKKILIGSGILYFFKGKIN